MIKPFISATITSANEKIMTIVNMTNERLPNNNPAITMDAG